MKACIGMHALPAMFVALIMLNGDQVAQTYASFSVDELLTYRFPNRSSNDVDLDICKHQRPEGTDIVGWIVPHSRHHGGEKPSSQGHAPELNRSHPHRRKNLRIRYHDHWRQSRRRSHRAATARVDRLWDFAIIPYEIEANFSGPHRALFRQAMLHWENYTCVKFVEKEPVHHNYIVFTERPCGCCSFVGKRGNGPQAISIGQEYNFNKLTEEDVNSLGLPYDFDSIMHYARNTFSKHTNLDTILPRDDSSALIPLQIGGGRIGEGGSRKRPEIGQRVRLSIGDIAQTNKLYNCPRCGRTLQGPSGRLSAAEFETADGLCEWRITATHGERIQLNITQMDIFETENCETDYVEVRDGYWHQSDLIGRYCGTGTLPDTLLSSGYRMTVIYRTSSNANKHSGFGATYEAICGGDLSLEDTLVLQSPNYPDEYRPAKECVWKIITEEKFQVALKFQAFEVESHDNCVYDYVEIVDGHDNDSPVIGKYCGFKLPEDIRSSDNKLMLKFVSDSTVQKGGFSATMLKEFDECVNTDHGCDHICINTLGSFKCECKIGYELHSDGKKCEDACGGMLEGMNGTLTSPSFPDLYPPNKNCIWEIVAPPQHRITLNFTHFELEGTNQECEYDSVDVSSRVRDVTVKKHGVFCGTQKPSSITSEGNVLRVEFNSDNSVQKSGFAAVFFTDKDECSTNNGGCQHICRNTIGSFQCACFNGFVLHPNGRDCKEGTCMHHVHSQQGGEITSPNYPLEYPSKKECAWLFSTTPGHRLKLVFDDFELEPHQECSYDSLSVYDGENTDSSSLGIFCGARAPHPLLSSNNKMYLVFKSDASVSRKGFKARHSTVCGGRLQARAGVQHIYSHVKYGDQDYNNGADCDWLLEAEGGTGFVRLQFMAFELEGDNPTDCGYDSLTLYDGYDDSTEPLNVFCGTKLPSDVVTGPVLLVRFKTDDNIAAKGFSLAYSLESTGNNISTGLTRISLKPPVF
ncbi:tolloid-like protein 1 isoform X2 [Varroa destructor]|uniref:Metalloendopeptidase n=1 Tax=Varroa destructor TaxID=109461 RepID=A0A7M7KSR9_VARDE|nr:tolloid-like protein 1 isoform X2 [Varroa destructor]